MSVITVPHIGLVLLVVGDSLGVNCNGLTTSIVVKVG